MLPHKANNIRGSKSSQNVSDKCYRTISVTSGIGNFRLFFRLLFCLEVEFWFSAVSNATLAALTGLAAPTHFSLSFFQSFIWSMKRCLSVTRYYFPCPVRIRKWIMSSYPSCGALSIAPSYSILSVGPSFAMPCPRSIAWNYVFRYIS